MATTVNGRYSGVEAHGDRPGGWDQRHRGGGHIDAAGAWAEAGGGGGGYAKSSGGHAGAGGGWASADQAVSDCDSKSGRWDNHNGGNWGGGVDMGSKGDNCRVMHAEGRGAAERERERAEGLDREDVEVVGLLQRMAKEAQESPSRSHEQSPSRPRGHAPSPTPRWDGPMPNTACRPQPFRMPRPQQGTGAPNQGGQMVRIQRWFQICYVYGAVVISFLVFVDGFRINSKDAQGSSALLNHYIF